MKVMRRLLGDALTIGAIMIGALALLLGTLGALVWIVFMALGFEAIGPVD